MAHWLLRLLPPQEVEPTVGEKLCRLWQKIETDDDTLSGHPAWHQGTSTSHSPHMSHYPPRHPQHHLSYPTPYSAYLSGYPMGPHMFPDRSRMPPMVPQPSLYPTPRLGPYRPPRPWWGPLPLHMQPPPPPLPPPTTTRNFVTPPRNSSRTYSYSQQRPSNAKQKLTKEEKDSTT